MCTGQFFSKHFTSEGPTSLQAHVQSGFAVVLKSPTKRSLTSKKCVPIELVMYMQFFEMHKLVTHTLVGNDRYKLDTGNSFT